MTTREKIKIGDRIKFRALTRYSHETVWRKVNGFWNGCPTVRYQGYGDFVVRLEEILEIEREG